MPRNLDLITLRSFVAVADTGGVTRASGYLNLTQSAVSMQLKRLEKLLDVELLDRSGRRIALTSAGEQLLGYARKMLVLNDEVYGRLTDQIFEGEITLGVPKDIVNLAIPPVLRRFAMAYPRMRVQLLSSYTNVLKDLYEKGKCDLILTTEGECSSGGQVIIEAPMLWYGAKNGTAWRARPLRLAYDHNCNFRESAQIALNDAGIPWEMAVESDSSRTVEASVIADLAISAQLEGTPPDQMIPIAHGGSLPDLGDKKINLYGPRDAANPVLADLAEIVRQAFKARPIQAVA